jgi:arginase
MKISILAVPYEAGQRSVGVGLGPARLLEAGLANELRELGHEVHQTTIDLPVHAPPHELAKVVALQRLLADAVQRALAADEFPIILAGNCSSAVGTLAARPRDAAVLWFDAHGDFNTADTTTSGMLDGMALAMATGRCLAAMAATVPGFSPVDETRVFLVGARDLDPGEQKLLAESRVRQIAATDARSIATALRTADHAVPQVYVHLDLDVLDPASARANRFAVPGGIAAQDLPRIVESIGATAHIFALAVTAYDPEWDKDGRACKAAIRAVKAALPRTLTTE